jgi:hypothetical protein
MIALKPVHLLAGGAVLAAVLYVSLRGGVKAVATDIGGAAVDMVDGVVSGAVVAVGEKINIPQTNLTQCEQDKAAGKTWDASFSCPASDFIRHLWN